VTDTLDPEKSLAHLTEKVEQLAALCQQLRQENQQLKAQQATMAAEREYYLSRTHSARERVETMLNRLQSLSRQS